MVVSKEAWGQLSGNPLVTEPDVPGVPTERIDPHILALIALIFPAPPLAGLDLFARLCRQAKEKQWSHDLFGAQSVGVLSFAGIIALREMIGRPVAYDTLLAFLNILESLFVLSRYRSQGKTYIYIPLGERSPLSITELLAGLSSCQAKDRKTVEMAKRVKAILVRYNPENLFSVTSPEKSESHPQGEEARSSHRGTFLFQERLFELMREEKIPLAKCKRIALWLSSPSTRVAMKEYMRGQKSERLGASLQLRQKSGDSSEDWYDAFGQRNSQEGDSQPTQSPSPQKKPQHQATIGDSHKAKRQTGNPDHQDLGDSEQAQSPQTFEVFLPEETVSGDSEQAQSSHISVNQAILGLESPRIASESPESESDRRESPDLGDSGKHSSIDNLLPLGDSLEEKGISIEYATTNEKKRSLESPRNEWTGTEEELERLALEYLDVLDPLRKPLERLGQKQQEDRIRERKRALGGFRNKLRQNPFLARAAAINALLQSHWYQVTGNRRVGSRGGWFHKSFERYSNPEKPMEILDDIQSWAQSPYTLRQIAEVLNLEHQRQSDWRNLEGLHRPWASCVTKYHQDALEQANLGQPLVKEGATLDEVETDQEVAASSAEGTTEDQEWQGAIPALDQVIDQEQIPFLTHNRAQDLARRIHRQAWYLTSHVRVCRASETGVSQWQGSRYIHKWVVEVWLPSTQQYYILRQEEEWALWWQELSAEIQRLQQMGASSLVVPETPKTTLGLEENAFVNRGEQQEGMTEPVARWCQKMLQEVVARLFDESYLIQLEVLASGRFALLVVDQEDGQKIIHRLMTYGEARTLRDQWQQIAQPISTG